jgi:predicted amidohydrolase YtcJ
MPKRLAFINGAIYLGGGEIIDRGAVVSNGSQIEGVGPVAGFKRQADMRIIDLGGRLLLPGLTDCHVHLVGYAHNLLRVDLSDTGSIEDGLEKVRAFTQDRPAGAWIRGRGWDRQRWQMTGFPNRTMLDTVTPDNPAALWSRDGHLMWVNSVALEKIGIGDRGYDVEGGEIESDHQGRPTGILKENAADLIPRGAGEEDPDTVLDAIERACQRFLNLGLTGVHSVETRHHAASLDHALERHKVPLTLFRLREIDGPADMETLRPSPGSRCIKLYADGALGSQTASMLEPYCGQPENRGIPVTSKADLSRLVGLAAEKGFSVAVHAIGDRANKEVLDVYEEVIKQRHPDGVVFRVEHAQVLRPEDIGRFGRLGIVASMQPIHLVSDRGVAERYWGDRSRHAYNMKGIMRAGGTVAFGSDAPIEEADPLKGIHAAVTRRDPARPDSPAWNAGECLTVAEAVDCYTVGAALASGRAGKIGSVRQGSRADFTVLDKNILAGPDPDIILDTSVDMTVVGGQILYTA